MRDQVVDFVRIWSDKTQIAPVRLVRWIGVGRSKFHDWRTRYGRVNEHNGWVERDWWLEPSEKQAIVQYAQDRPEEGYRRLTYMMMDANVVAASPSTVYRVLKAAGLIGRRNLKPSRKGTGFDQPDAPHRHWHTDIAYLNICGTFYYLCSFIDGYSRLIVHWDIRISMTELDIELIAQVALEKFPGQTPRIISDNGPQYISRDFKEFIRVTGLTHVRTSPYYPQSNGKAEAWNKTVKGKIRQQTPLSLEDAKRITTNIVEKYNNERLHSAIGYVTPRDMIEGRQKQIHAERERKLNQARERRKARRLELTPIQTQSQDSCQSDKRKRAPQECDPPGITDCGGQLITTEPGPVSGSPSCIQLHSANA